MHVLIYFLSFVFKYTKFYIKYRNMHLHIMMLFQSELDLNVLDLLGRSVVSGRWAHMQKQETKRIGGSSPVTSPMPKLVLFGGREDQLLRE